MKYLLPLLFLTGCSITGPDIITVNPNDLKYPAGTHIGGGSGFYKTCQGTIKDYVHVMLSTDSPRYIVAWNCPDVQGFPESEVYEKDIHQ